MNSNQKLHQAKLNQWAARITDQKSSGLTVREWCLQTGVTIHAYNYWKHLLKEDLVEQALPDIAPLTPPDRMALPAVHLRWDASAGDVMSYLTLESRNFLTSA